jgi:galactonate dehydratase
MKITGVETFPVLTPPPHRGGTNWMFLRLDTDTGISGYGEVMLLSSAFRLPVVARLIHDMVEQYVAGKSPYNIELLWEHLYARAGYSRYPEQTKLGIISGLEMACWDIVGKDVGQPVYNLLGGMMRDRVRTYTYIYAEDTGADVRATNRHLWMTPDALASRARHYVDLGFTGVKFDPFSAEVTFDQGLGQVVPVEYSMGALATAEVCVGAIRAAIGNEADILIGTHGQMTAAGAIRVARRLEQFDPLWFEEPVPRRMRPKWPKWPGVRPFRLQPVSVLQPNTISPVSSRRKRLPSSTSTWARWAAYSSQRRSPPSPRPTTYRSRRTSTTVPSWRRHRCNWRSAAPTS